MEEDKRSHHILEEILKQLKVNNLLLYKIEQSVNRPTVAYIKFGRGHNMSAAAVALNVGQSVPAAPVETNADGSNFVFDPTKIIWSIQDSTVCSMSANNPDGSVSFTALKAGVTQVGFSDSATGLSATGTITVNAVTPPGPTSASIKFGTPA
jgi:hypothetical protein